MEKFSIAKIIYGIYYLILKIFPHSFYKYIILFFKKMIHYTKKISLDSTLVVDYEVENIKYKIFVRKQNTQAHYTYTELLGKGRVYELAIAVCLNSILNPLSSAS